MRLSRRSLFRLLAASPAAAWGAPDFIVRSPRPEDLEMPLDGFSTWITPVDRFFVRTHVYRPTVRESTWRLNVRGLVDRPVSLDLAELKRLPRAELVGFLECAGNGRSFYQPSVPGAQWRFGAIGNARWTGVRLADVLRRAGLQPAATQIAFNGADVPLGSMSDFVRSIPAAKALHPDTLLAFEMNGVPLPPAHGFPLRVVAPGWAGDSWVKWLTDIEAMDHEPEGFFMKTAYRHPTRPLKPGEAVSPAEMVPVSHIPVKSVISSPVDGQKLAPGPVVIRGAAWSGLAPIARVEVSLTDGRTWQPARLGPDSAPYAWRLWEFPWNPPPRRSYTVRARATDSAGHVQPLAEAWNPSGYLWNVVQPVRVETGAARPETPPPPAIPKPPLPPELRSSCIGCHTEELISQQHLTRAQWDKEIAKMSSWGAKVTPEERAKMLDFLAAHFGPE